MGTATKIKRVRRQGGLVALASRLQEASQYEVLAGVRGVRGQAPHANGDGLTVAEIGALHEYGYTFTASDGSKHTVPARSFVRAPIRAAEAEIEAALAKAGQQVVQGMEPKRALGAVALRVQGIMQKAVADGLSPPLAESTVARRKGPRAGHSGPRVIKPLIDTGQLRAAITAEVVVSKKGKKKKRGRR